MKFISKAQCEPQCQMVIYSSNYNKLVGKRCYSFIANFKNRRNVESMLISCKFTAVFIQTWKALICNTIHCNLNFSSYCRMHLLNTWIRWSRRRKIYFWPSLGTKSLKNNTMKKFRPDLPFLPTFWAHPHLRIMEDMLVLLRISKAGYYLLVQVLKTTFMNQTNISHGTSPTKIQFSQGTRWFLRTARLAQECWKRENSLPRTFLRGVQVSGQKKN